MSMDSKLNLKTDGKNYEAHIKGTGHLVENALVNWMIDDELVRVIIMRAAQRFMQNEIVETMENHAPTEDVQE